MPRSMQILGLLCLACGVAAAQTAGEITGEVRDQSGAVAPNAAVIATNTATNVARSTLTNSAGIYSFPGLAPGPYQVKVAVAGFTTAVTTLELQVQQTARIDFALSVGASTQTVEVSAGADLLNTENATVGIISTCQRYRSIRIRSPNASTSARARTRSGSAATAGLTSPL